MRKLLILAAAFAAAPALAQPAPDVNEDEIRDTLPSAAELERMGDMMGRMVGAFMDLPVGDLVAAVDPEHRAIEPGSRTVRDMATRDDPYAEERMRSSIEVMTGQVGTMAATLATMMPVLTRTMADFERRMEEAMAPVEGDLED